MNYTIFSYHEGTLLNIIFLWLPWIFFCYHGIRQKNYSFFLLGIGLFMLFIKEWLVTTFGPENLSFAQIVFWELLFLFAFFWVVYRIYLEQEKLGNRYISLDGYNYKSNKLTRCLFQDFGNIFSLITSILFIVLFRIFLEVATSEAIQAVIGVVFFVVMAFKLERQFFYWGKDYAYFGSLWTQPQVINSLRRFYGIIGLGISLLFVFTAGHFFNFWVFHEKISLILPLFSLIKFVSLAYLFLFLYRVFVGYSKIEKNFHSIQLINQDWVEESFTTDDPTITTYQRLVEKYPKMSFPETHKKDSLAMLQHLAELLKKTDSELVYLHSPYLKKTENQVVVSKIKKLVPEAKEDIDSGYSLNSEFSLEDYFPGISDYLQSDRMLFFPNVNNHSLEFKKKLSSLFSSNPRKIIKSLIVYPFSYKGDQEILLLINSNFPSEISLQPAQEDLLKKFTEKLSKVDFSKVLESNLQTETQTELEATHEPIEPIESAEDIEEKKTEKTTDQHLQTELLEGSYATTSDTTEVKSKKSEIPDKASSPIKESSYIKPTSKTGKSLFPSTRKKNKFIIQTSLEQTYSESSAKVNHAFRPAANRNSDKIVFEVKALYQDKLQNSVCLVTNTGRKGKLFVFNELHQNQSFIAATDLALQNLFYSHLTEKKVELFMEEWHKGFKPFSSKDVCQSLAMHFHPENHQLSYYNAGINHAYFYDSNYDTFSPFHIHQSKLVGVSKRKKKFTTTQLQLQPDNLILIFSKEILEIKNRSGEKINIEMLFEIIRKNPKKPLDKMIKSLETEIKNVAYSLVENQQTIFMAKILT